MSKDKNVPKPMLSLYSSIFENSPKDTISPDRLTQFMVLFLGHGMLGLILGAIVDRLSGILGDVLTDMRTDAGVILKEGETKEEGEGDNDGSNDFIDRLFLVSLGIIQLFINVILIFTLTRILPTSVYERWQRTVPGIAFAALYFGIQSNMFKNIRALIE